MCLPHSARPAGSDIGQLEIDINLLCGVRPSKLVSVVQAWSDCENQLHDLRTEIFCSLILPSFPLHGNSEVSALVTIADFSLLDTILN